MNYLIKHSKKLLSLVLVLALFTSCEDYQDLDIDPVDTGDADFSSYVAVGNSLTAGLQNNALYESGQEYSFPNLISRQLNNSENFNQPLISEPGISSSGRIELVSLDPLITTRNMNQGEPINDNKPFANVGVPGALLVDYLNPNGDGDLKERATNPQHPNFNPFYGIVMEDSELAKDAPNLHNQVAKQDPTLITFWLGNNAVLNFVASGGDGQTPTPTDPNTFAQLYQASAQALASTGANVVVYNIPNVTNLPFVFYLRLQLEQQGVIQFNEETQSYQLVTEQGNFNIYIETDDGARIMREADFPILPAQEYFALIQSGETAPPIDANGDGVPESAIPDQYILDGPVGGPEGSSEIEQAAGAILQYNTTIADAASSNGFVTVDINSLFNDVFTDFQTSGGETGYQTDGLNLRPVPGELFSFDGIHPSNRGSAVLANETINVINSSFNANIDNINVAKIPEGFPVISE